MTPEAMNAHVVAIAATHGVAIVWRTSGSITGRAWRRGRRITIPPVRSEITYALALHELGHILGHQSGRRLSREVQAWAWAKDTAMSWTPRMTRYCRKLLASYERWAVRRQASSTTRRTFVDHAALVLAVKLFPLRTGSGGRR